MDRHEAQTRRREPSETCLSLDSRLTREQVVDRIMHLNPSAREEFLSRFGQASLAEYLQRLDASKRPRGRDAIWVRRGPTPAIVTRLPSV